MSNSMPAPLKQFVDEVSAFLQSTDEERAVLNKVGACMKTLVAKDDWLNDAYAKEHPEYYQQYLLYADPQARFSVVSFVWGPGQCTPIHDHTVWGAIGMLRGAECAQNYALAADGKPVATGEELRLNPGDVEFVSPSIGDVHKVRNVFDDRVSISIHVYGADIGKVKRHVFPEEGGPAKEFISGYSNPA